MQVSTLSLENEFLRVVTIPSLGGKISSIFDKKTGFECLFQNPKHEYKLPQLYDSFGSYDASGFDDAFPNINESFTEMNGKVIHFPDHGEVWTMDMDGQYTDDGISLSGKGQVFEYEYFKTLSLHERSLHVHYDICNTGQEPIPFFWTMHCLINVDENIRLILPRLPEYAENVFGRGDLGAVGRLINMKNDIPDLTRMPQRNAMRKYYLAGAVSEGKCGYEFLKEKLRLMITYDQTVLPYLGMWCTMGGFRGDVNAALQPSSAFYDSVDTAIQRGTLVMIESGARKSFELRLSLSDLNEENE